MRKLYDPRRWFWIIAETLEIYSSASDAIVSETDEAYIGFIADGTVATVVLKNDLLKIRIDFYEQTVTERRRREAGTDDAGGSIQGRAWMANLDAQIKVLRAQLVG